VLAVRRAVLMTIGYEGRSPSEFVQTLRQNGVAEVVDVRQLPLSRRRGFSKSALADMLAANGIGYTNMRELGTPAAARKSYSQTGDFAALKKQYLDHLAKQGPMVSRLYNMALAGDRCLMCFEREPLRCHRSLLAGAVARHNGRRIAVHHL
jgi:uncharacterized protein (DUF488 family)